MHKKRLITASVILIVILVLVGVYIIGHRKKPAEPHYSQLTGLEVSAAEANLPILGVMIENSEAARPQTGLDNAGIVLETVTEGGITRYVALYQENTPEIVGPVRSLRPYFLDWLMGFDASIAHVGGSPEALKLADVRKAKSLSQFKYSQPYYRDSSREAPHNMYAKTKDLRSLQDELGHGKSQFDGFPRSNDTPGQDPQTQKVTIGFSGPLFQVEFRYNKDTNNYTRYLAGSPHIDKATDKPITVKNVVVIKLNGQSAIGSGEALVFKDGNITKARWEKPAFEDRIKLVDDKNNELSLNRGNTWFAAPPKNAKVTY